MGNKAIPISELDLPTAQLLIEKGVFPIKLQSAIGVAFIYLIDDSGCYIGTKEAPTQDEWDNRLF